MALPRSNGLHWAIAVVLSLISLLFTLITLLSGVRGSSIASYLSVDTTNIAITAKLAGSVFLQALSTISGSDLVGQSGTRQSLGLASTYSVSLLTACGLHDDASIICDPLRVGFTFNPGTDLKLDSTATLSTAYYNELHVYSIVSTFTAVAYIIAALLTVLSCLTIVVSRRVPSLGLVSRASSGLAALLVFAATIASIVTFVKLRDVFNNTLSDVGVSTTLNPKGIALSAAGAVASIVAFALVLFTRPAASAYRQPYRQEKRGGGGVEGSVGADEAGLMARQPRAAGVGAGFLARMPTWNRQRYVQIDANKAPNARSRDPSPESDREGLIDPARDDVPHDSLNRENGYPMSTWGKKQTRQNLEHVPTAYDPSLPPV
ncbi:SUR7/PalI family-domain-containing protein [Nemania diffusa]|nr:SUR7/PalI family-domain-containing protein [Nemania diffusa]